MSSDGSQGSAISVVYKLHNRRNARVEVPASLEAVANALNRLVKLALKAARRIAQTLGYWGVPLGILRVRIRFHVPVNLAQETINAGNPLVLPIEFAVGRRREQGVHAGGGAAVALDHFVRRHNVAKTLRHLGPGFDDHALRE